MNMNKKVIPAKYKRIVRNDKEHWVLIFDIKDFLTDKKPGYYQKEISKILDDLLRQIKIIMDAKKPSQIPRKKLWDIGDMIIKAREDISTKYGIYITNIVEAISIKLGLATRTVNFFVQFRETISKDKIDETIPWKVYQIALLLRDKSKFEECINLYKCRRLKNTKEVLEYVQTLNKKSN